jgi:hypothetical protein
VVEAKAGEARCDGALTPADGRDVNVEAVETALEETAEAEREIADAAADFEEAMIWSQTAIEQFSGGDLTGLGEGGGIGRAVVTAAQVGGRQESIGTAAEIVGGIKDPLGDTTNEPGNRQHYSTSLRSV